MIGAYIVAVLGSIPAIDHRPGGIIHDSKPGDIQWLPKPKPAGDCQGCGAPLKAYIHHCEYCRREQ